MPEKYKEKKVKRAEYTTVKHVPRIKFGLSNNDYCIAKAIYTLSNEPDSAFPGWYYGKIATLGQLFNLSRSTAYTCVKKLEDTKLIEKNNSTGFLKTTRLWWEEFESLQITKK